MSKPRSFWITNHFANHFLRPLLRGPLGSKLGRRIALLRVTGRRSGHVYELPVQYARDGRTVWVMPGAPERKTWWRNLRGNGADIELRLAGRPYRAHARALEGARAPQEVAAGLAEYLRSIPRAAQTLGLDAAATPADIERVLPSTVLVRVDLDDKQAAP